MKSNFTKKRVKQKKFDSFFKKTIDQIGLLCYNADIDQIGLLRLALIKTGSVYDIWH